MKSKILTVFFAVVIMSIVILLLLLIDSRFEDTSILKEWFLAFGFLVPASFVYVWMVRRLQQEDPEKDEVAKGSD